MFGTDGPTANDSLRPVRSPLMRLLRRARFTTAFVGTIPWLAVTTLTVFAALGSGASRADYIALFNGPHTATFAADGSGGLMFSTSGVSQDTVFYTILGGTDFATGGFKLAAVAFAASLYPVVPSGQSPRRRVLPTPLPTATLSPGPSCGCRWRSGRKPPAGCRLSCQASSRSIPQ